MPISKPEVAFVQAQPRRTRRMRSPRHTFQIRTRPWQLQPFALIPVLPGETMKNLGHQSRTITDPIKNRLVGWWLEHYYFYVPHRSMEHKSDYESMMLDPSHDMSSLEMAANVKTYHRQGQDWTYECLKTVVDEFFRNEEEGNGLDPAGPEAIDGVPLCGLREPSWLDSARSTGSIPSGATEDVDVLPGGTVSDPTHGGLPDHLSGTFANAFTYWKDMVEKNLTDQTYEDFLRSYGVRAPREELDIKPELLRYSREFQYPVSAIDPTDGSAASAVSWNTAFRADKDRRFNEPGFILGLQCTRPKIYRSGQGGSAADVMDNAYRWLPAILRDEPYTSVIEILSSSGDGPIDISWDYYFDLKDLLMYGDQFLNFAVTATDANLIDIPVAADTGKGPEWRFPIAADLDGLFAGASPANQIRTDGVVTPNILGMVEDTTP